MKGLEERGGGGRAEKLEKGGDGRRGGDGRGEETDVGWRVGGTCCLAHPGRAACCFSEWAELLEGIPPRVFVVLFWVFFFFFFLYRRGIKTGKKKTG